MSKKKRFSEVLINPTEDELYEREPLMEFSFYLSGRNNVLLLTLDEIIENLDEGFSATPINVGGLIQKASDQMWFWTLGAYEVIRTISQARDCFSDEFNQRIVELKKELGKARMPSAKMEKQGKKVSVTSNRSPDGWDFENRDLLIGDPDDIVSARCLLQMYDDVISSLKRKDVIKQHSDSYQKAG